jgi:hypothetical protein
MYIAIMTRNAFFTPQTPLLGVWVDAVLTTTASADLRASVTNLLQYQPHRLSYPPMIHLPFIVPTRPLRIASLGFIRNWA